jgi:hypothetical protein
VSCNCKIPLVTLAHNAIRENFAIPLNFKPTNYNTTVVLRKGTDIITTYGYVIIDIFMIGWEM